MKVGRCAERKIQADSLDFGTDKKIGDNAMKRDHTHTHTPKLVFLILALERKMSSSSLWNMTIFKFPENNQVH